MIQFQSILRFTLCVALLLAMATGGSCTVTPRTEPTRSFSASERALFGYSYSEDCLFGSSSANLYGAHRAEKEKEQQQIEETIPVKAVKGERSKKQAPTAFVRKD